MKKGRLAEELSFGSRLLIHWWPYIFGAVFLQQDRSTKSEVPIVGATRKSMHFMKYRELPPVTRHSTALLRHCYGSGTVSHD
jgi:hypothetical protein